MPLDLRKRELGDRLREARLESALSLEDVAGELRMSKQSIWAWEHGKVSISAMQLADLALLYGTPTDYLLFGIRMIPEELKAIYKAKAA